MSELNTINANLVEHFAGLRDVRAPHHYPTYAIEHHLDVASISALKLQLSDHLARQGALAQSHWLCWIVVAAEIGYTFDGDEYWDTFADEIPTWNRYGADRRQIRRWFKSFAKEFGGYQPTGRWASHFSIIAWPIAHSVLPRDLQNQFARLVYDLRFELADRPHIGVETIGEMLRTSRQHHARSSRFNTFLEQADLTGQLVLGLRDEDVHTETPRLQPATMARLVADVSRTQSGGDWLREARKVLRDARSRVAHGLVSGPHRQTGASGDRSAGRSAIIAHLSSQGSWQLAVTLPDFALVSSSLNIDLKSVGGTVSFFDEMTRLPLRSLLGLSNRSRDLKQLSQSITQYEFLRIDVDAAWRSQFSALCRIVGGPRWLLRVQADGVARQVFGHHVRAGEEYLLACAHTIEANLRGELGLRELKSDTGGIELFSLSIPKRFSPAFDRALVNAGLGRIHSTVIEPVGLVPRHGGDAGRTIWLASEEPILSLQADSANSEFVVTLDEGATSRFKANEDATPTLIALGHLPLGRHRISVTTIVNAAHLGEKSEAQDLEVEVRGPVSWLHSDPLALGFRVGLDPDGAPLDAIFSGEASISLIAPSGRRASVSADTYSARGQVREHIDLGTLSLPATPNAIRQKLARLGKEPASEEVYSSPRVDLNFSLEELGSQSLVFPRRVEPLRWVLTKIGADRIVRLIDDHLSETEVEVNRYDISRPDQKIPLSLSDCLRGIPLEPPGALFSARMERRSFRAAMCASPQAYNSLANLGVVVRVDRDLASPAKIPRIIALRRLWSGASWQGQLVAHRKSEVLGELDSALVVAACGSSWGTKYTRCKRDPTMDLSTLQREVGGSPGFAHRMKSTNFLRDIEGSAPDLAFIHWVKTYEIVDDSGLAALAFQLAFRPGDMRFENTDARASTLATLASHASLVRGAFLARLASERIEQQSVLTVMT